MPLNNGQAKEADRLFVEATSLLVEARANIGLSAPVKRRLPLHTQICKKALCISDASGLDNIREAIRNASRRKGGLGFTSYFLGYGHKISAPSADALDHRACN